MARPSSFAPAIAVLLCKLKSKGYSDVRAAARAGIDVRTLYRWLALGKRGDDNFADFSVEFRAAECRHRDQRRDEMVRTFRSRGVA